MGDVDAEQAGAAGEGVALDGGAAIDLAQMDVLQAGAAGEGVGADEVDGVGEVQLRQTGAAPEGALLNPQGILRKVDGGDVRPTGKGAFADLCYAVGDGHLAAGAVVLPNLGEVRAAQDEALAVVDVGQAAPVHVLVGQGEHIDALPEVERVVAVGALGVERAAGVGVQGVRGRVHEDPPLIQGGVLRADVRLHVAVAHAPDAGRGVGAAGQVLRLARHGRDALRQQQVPQQVGVPGGVAPAEGQHALGVGHRLGRAALHGSVVGDVVHHPLVQQEHLVVGGGLIAYDLIGHGCHRGGHRLGQLVCRLGVVDADEVQGAAAVIRCHRGVGRGELIAAVGHPLAEVLAVGHVAEGGLAAAAGGHLHRGGAAVGQRQLHREFLAAAGRHGPGHTAAGHPDRLQTVHHQDARHLQGVAKDVFAGVVVVVAKRDSHGQIVVAKVLGLFPRSIKVSGVDALLVVGGGSRGGQQPQGHR